MHHHKTYMYINFQQNQASRSVKTVHRNLFADNRKSHKFATTKSNIGKNYYFRYARAANSHAYGVILTHLTCYSHTHAIDKFTHAFLKNHTHTHAIL